MKRMYKQSNCLIVSIQAVHQVEFLNLQYSLISGFCVLTREK